MVYMSSSFTYKQTILEGEWFGIVQTIQFLTVSETLNKFVSFSIKVPLSTDMQIALQIPLLGPRPLGDSYIKYWGTLDHK